MQVSHRYQAETDPQQLLERSALWRQCVGEPIASHVRAVFYAEGRLLLHADSSVWCNKLLHQQPTLIRRLRQHAVFRDLTDLHVRVAPPLGRRAARVNTAAPLSVQAAHTIASAADDIEDPALRAALNRLARNVR